LWTNNETFAKPQGLEIKEVGLAPKALSNSQAFLRQSGFALSP